MTFNKETLIQDVSANITKPAYWAGFFQALCEEGQERLAQCKTDREILRVTIETLDGMNSQMRKLINGAIKVETEMEDAESAEA